MASLTVTGVTYSGGSVFINFDDGGQTEYESQEEVVHAAGATNQSDLLKALAVLHFVALSPDASDSGVITGKTFTLNMSSELSPLVISD